LLLDGGLSTALERDPHGAALCATGLWSAEALLEASGLEKLEAAHASFAASGARVLSTATYQLSLAGLLSRGLPPASLDALATAAVRVARIASGSATATASGAAPALVAGSLGPFGATCADGSEYTGAYAAPLRIRPRTPSARFDTAVPLETRGGRRDVPVAAALPHSLSVADLVRFHWPRVRALARAQPDLFACETLPGAADALALAAAVRALAPRVGAWFTFTLAPPTDEAGPVRTAAGEPLCAAAEALRRVCGRQLLGVGVNCVAPAAAVAAVRALRRSGWGCTGVVAVEAQWRAQASALLTAAAPGADVDADEEAAVRWAEAAAVDAGLLGDGGTGARAAAVTDDAGAPRCIVAYPNAGRDWDADAGAWSGDATGGPAFAEVVWQLVEAGADAVGGCCSVGPAEIAAVAAALTREHAHASAGLPSSH
jgi:homocysteine S-methyltransferase